MIKVVAGVWRTAPTAYFIAMRRGPAYADCWEFPGGKVEDGETDEDALKREWREEFGIGISVGAKLCSRELVNAEGEPFQITAYLIEVDAVDWPGRILTNHTGEWFANVQGMLSLRDSQVTPSLRPLAQALALLEAHQELQARRNSLAQQEASAPAIPVKATKFEVREAPDAKGGTRPVEASKGEDGGSDGR